MTDAVPGGAAGRAQAGAPTAAVGVVIATRDRRDRLLATLRRLRSLPERPPIAVVDNGSSDGTVAAVSAADPEVRVIDAGANLGAGGRSLGVRALDVPLVALCDDDSWWAPGALARAERLFRSHPRLGLVAARISVGPEGRLDPTCEQMEQSPLARRADLPGPPVLGFVAAGAVVRRSAYIEVGGFHPRIGLGGEEELLAMDLAAAGWGVAYVPEVVAHHHPLTTDDRRDRRAAELRNALWVAWLRRPPATALAATAAGVAAIVRHRELHALPAALAGLPWVLRERRVVPPDVERALRLVEKARR